MDLRAYYKKVRAVEAQMEGDDIVVSSIATPEGGKDGVLTEAPREVAAKLVAEGRAQVAGKPEAELFRAQLREAKEKADHDEAARRVQVVVIPSHDLPRAGLKQAKDRS